MELCADFYFSRIFSYSNRSWKDGEEETLESNIEFCRSWTNSSSEFELLREHLNSVKGRLGNYSDGKQMRKEWHMHTESLHLFSGISKVLVRHFAAELATRAWLKMYDTLARFPQLIIPMTEKTQAKNDFTSVHLCEAPGAFISAVNHRLDSFREGCPYSQWRWYANTLNPYHELSRHNEAIFDDQMIVSHPENWLFGYDNTGDITSPANVADFWNKIGRQSVDLVTADGAIDCQSNPAEQELTLSLLHYAEVTTAAGLLRPGGNLVIKLFTLFEFPTACLVFLLTKIFDEVNAYKPAASKPGNSEVYFVCLGYVFRPELVEKLLTRLKEKQPLNFKLTDSFLADHIECARFFSRLQSDAIERNISAFEEFRHKDLVRLYDQVTAARYNAEQYFIERACAPLFPLNPCRKLIKANTISYLSLLDAKPNRFLDINNDFAITCEVAPLAVTELTLVQGRTLASWQEIGTSLFCSTSTLTAESVPLLKDFDGTTTEELSCRCITIKSDNQNDMTKELFSQVALLSCMPDECICLVGLPPPLSRCLAGVLRILLTKFQCVRLLGKGVWYCVRWQGEERRFDADIVAHLSKASELTSVLSDDIMGIVEVVKLSTLFHDRKFRSSLFYANNNFLDLISNKIWAKRMGNVDIPSIYTPIPYSDFVKCFLLPGRACVFGEWITRGWSGRADFTMPDGSGVNIEKFRQIYGQCKTSVADCSASSYSYDSSKMMLVSEYLDTWKSNQCLYMKDFHFTRDVPKYRPYDVPVYFQSDWLNECWDSRRGVLDNCEDDFRFIYLGPAGTWTPLHCDVIKSFSWSANLFGIKRWLLYEPGEIAKLGPYVQDEPEKDFDKLASISRDVGAKFADIYQQPGEILFVPSEWGHQVRNETDVVSLNHNWLNAFNIAICFKNLEDEWLKTERELAGYGMNVDDEWSEKIEKIVDCSAGCGVKTFISLLITIAKRRIEHVPKVSEAYSTPLEILNLYPELEPSASLHSAVDLLCIKSLIQQSLLSFPGLPGLSTNGVNYMFELENLLLDIERAMATV